MTATFFSEEENISALLGKTSGAECLEHSSLFLLLYVFPSSLVHLRKCASAMRFTVVAALCYNFHKLIRQMPQD